MKIALIGYGRMGHEIEEAAVRRGHSVSLKIDINNQADLNPDQLKEVDVAIEFSSPASALENVTRCLQAGVPVVSGTTGWQKDYETAKRICIENNTSFIQSSNFSIGVNLLFRLNNELAGYMKDFPDYSVAIEEIHHIRKLDAPSGTAISLAAGIKEYHGGYNGWTLEPGNSPEKISITAIREGMVPGTHTVKWDSEIDVLSLRHEARNRKGFAVGAVVAAEFIAGRKGVFTMKEVLGF
jgi:4-hydroxy-tetrahydrodipicolinate reductase